MKRLVVLVAGVAAMMLVAAVAFAGGSRNGATSAATEYGATWAITLTISPNPVAVNGYTTFSGVLTQNGSSTGTGDQTVVISRYSDSACKNLMYVEGPDRGWPAILTDSSGNYSVEQVQANVPAGHYYFDAASNGVHSTCFDLTVVATVVPPPPPSNVFLCYSAFQTNPGVWPASQAASLMAKGYWSPYAVAGNVTGGTNVGKYHLVCNLAAGQAAGQQFAGDDGYVAGTDLFNALTGAPGWYPVVP